MVDPLDAGVPVISAEQCRAARALLGWGADELAMRAGVTAAFVAAFEAGREPGDDADPGESVRIRRVLEEGGVAFIDSGETSVGGGPGLRLRSSPSYIDSDDLSSANDG